jgi:GntR family transcriptional regulator
VIPFRLTFRPGVPLYEQVVFAVKKAVVSGQMRAGDPFPSVRTLSKELKINPNTAHKVVAELVRSGLLEVNVGVGTVVAARATEALAARQQLIAAETEQLVVEAKRLGMTCEEIVEAVTEQWHRLEEQS